MSRDDWRLFLGMNPDDPFWIDDEGELSRAAMGQAVDARARELAADGPRRLALEARPTRQTVIDLLGALAADRTVVLLPLREPDDVRQDLARRVAVDPAPQTGQLWVRTSGSGGRPRWIVHLPQTLMAAAAAGATRLAFGRGAAWRVSLPLDHVGGLSLIWRAVVAGGALLATDDTKRETHRSLVPTQLHRLLADDQADQLRHLRCLLLGGASLPVALRRQALEAGLPLAVSYGMTETAAFCTASLPGDPLLAHVHYAGRPLWPGRVVADSAGIISVGGPALAVGQADDDGQVIPLATTADGFLATGDLGAVQGDAVFITGRHDNLIISGGEKLAAEELESALLGIDGVLDAVVVPMADPEYGQRPVAFLGTSPACQVGLDEVRRALAGSLATWKLPVQVLPLPPSHGLKHDRRFLRQLVDRQN